MEAYRKVLSAVYQKLGYTLDEHILDIILDPSQHKLINAPAGGVKTTLSQMLLSKEKLDFIKNRKFVPGAPKFLDTSEILCLVYNNHNVPDVKNVNKKIYSVFESLGLFSQSLIKENYVCQGLTVSTVHSHAKNFITKYKSLLKLREVQLANPVFLDALLSKTFEKVMGDTLPYTSAVGEYYALYTNLLLFDNDKHKDKFMFLTSMDSDTYDKYKQVFSGYDDIKKISKNQEYSDWIKAAIELCDKHHDVVRDEQYKHRYIIADEVQDFTPLMVEYLKKLIHDGARTIIIGDPDQTIYQFNGADHNTLKDLSESVGVEFTRFFMHVNRRCAEKTLSYARALLTKMDDREHQEITTVKPGGEFKQVYYETPSDEIEQVMDHFDSDYHSTNAFLFRTRDLSIPLTRVFYKQNRPYSLFNATSFHMHSFYSGFMETVKCVFVLQDRSVWHKLHRILPFSKKQMEDYLVFDSKNMPTKFPETLIWRKLDLLKLRKTFNTSEAWFWQIMFAQGLAANVSNVAARDVVDVLLDMYYKNFYHFLKKKDVYLEDVVAMIREDFDTENNLKWVITQIETRLNRLISEKQISAINVCTIHATKGLEFDRVYLMSMQEDEHQFDPQVDLRLYYVGSTRQRKSLVLSIDSSNPHQLAASEYIVPQSIELENRYDISPVTNFDHLFSSSDNPNIRRFAR